MGSIHNSTKESHKRAATYLRESRQVTLSATWAEPAGPRGKLKGYSLGRS